MKCSPLGGTADDGQNEYKAWYSHFQRKHSGAGVLDRHRSTFQEGSGAHGAESTDTMDTGVEGEAGKVVR